MHLLLCLSPSFTDNPMLLCTQSYLKVSTLFLHCPDIKVHVIHLKYLFEVLLPFITFTILKGPHSVLKLRLHYYICNGLVIMFQRAEL